MSSQTRILSNRLYGTDSLKVSDVKIFPGTLREVTEEQFAEQLNRSLAEIETGDFDLVDDDENSSAATG
ncbi:MAG: hypothetical protein GDA52_01500 [Rhodobacteraceae bacterium]|nr:hypothetical protein [Paracoccaceae bacterium]